MPATVKSKPINIRIVSTGKYLPTKQITAEDMDKRLGYPLGTSLNTSGVLTRYFIDENETASQMGATAASQALQKANLTISDIDCIVCCSATHEQGMPTTAALISEQFGDKARGIPTFDINSTCLSFVTALDLMSCVIEQERFNKVLLVSSEIASVGLDWKDKESCTLFGDAAAAVIIEKTKAPDSSKIIASGMETYSEGAHLTEIPGGGTRFHPRDYFEEDAHPHLFRMEGRRVFKLSSKVLPEFIDQLFDAAKMTLNDINLVVPHQASVAALRLLAKRFDIDYTSKRLMITVEKYGNTIASSIPLALHDAIEEQRIRRGDILMLVGTAAGLTIGGMILEY